MGCRSKCVFRIVLTLRGGELAVFFGFETELAARGVDVVAFFAAERDGNPSVAENVGEAFLTCDRRAFPRQTFDRVVRNQIHVRVEIECDVAEFLGLLKGVVDFLDQDKLERYHASVFFGKRFHGGQQLREWERFVHRHDFFADFVGRTVQ